MIVVAALIIAGALIYMATKTDAALDRLTASTDALTNAVGELVNKFAEATAELRSIATDTGDSDMAIRANALADKLDADVAEIAAAVAPPVEPPAEPEPTPDPAP